jgi:hypothetical protein
MINDELKNKVFEKYKNDNSKLELFNHIYLIFQEKDKALKEYNKINYEYKLISEKLIKAAKISKEKNAKWDNVKHLIHEFSYLME